MDKGNTSPTICKVPDTTTVLDVIDMLGEVWFNYEGRRYHLDWDDPDDIVILDVTGGEIRELLRFKTVEDFKKGEMFGMNIIDFMENVATITEWV